MLHVGGKVDRVC